MLYSNNFINDKIEVSYNFYSNLSFYNKVFFQNMKKNFYNDSIKFLNEKNINIKPTYEIK